jgi:hypothetical protein
MLEKSQNHHEYCEIMRRGGMEGLFGNEVEYDSSDRRGFDIIIDDDILMGKVNLASTQTKLRSHSNKNDFLEKETDYMNSSINDMSETNEELNNSSSSFNKRLTPQEEHDKKIQKGIGF